VDEDIREIDEHPFAVARSFSAEGAESRFLGFASDVIGD